MTWSPDCIASVPDRSTEEGFSIIKIHSHPTGYPAFSATDDEGDARLIPMIRDCIEADILHGSAIILPDGQMFGRVLRSGNVLEPVECISVAGDDLHFWYALLVMWPYRVS